MLQQTSTFLGILVALVTLVSGAWVAGRYVRRIYDELAKSSDRSRVFNKLENIALDAKKAMGVKVISISEPIPLYSPKKFQLIYSSEGKEEKKGTEDEKKGEGIVAERITGLVFSIKGIPKMVYETRHAAFNNDVSKDKDHPTEVTGAAQTDAGEQAILTIPLIYKKNFRGIAQFLTTKDDPFVENDIPQAMRWAPELAKLVAKLQENQEQDIPSKARGNSTLTSILFTDIEDFSNIAEHLNLESTAELLNIYYRRLVTVVLANRGKLQEYIAGDYP